MDLKDLRKLIQPVSAAPDNTKQNIVSVFGEKSQQGGDIKQQIDSFLQSRGISEEDILGMAMGSVGGGGGGIMKALKGMMGRGGIKNLAGKIGSKMKFPQGRGAPQSPTPSRELPPFIRKRIQDVQPNPLKQEAVKQQEIKNALNQLFKPNTVVRPEGIKGMRKVGVNVKR